MKFRIGGKVGCIFFIFCSHFLWAQYRIEKLGPEINSDQYDEISPVITRDGRTLYFTRIGTPEFNHTLIQDDVDLYKTLSKEDYEAMLKTVYSQIADEEIKSPINSYVNQDIWVADSRDLPFDRVFQPGFPLNNALPNSVCSLSPNDKTIVIINHFARDGSLFKGFSLVDRRDDGSFSFPEPIYVQDLHSKSPEINVSMSKDGDVIIMSLNRKEGKGDNDLYASFKLKYNLWSEPFNLGPVINGSAREITPYLADDKMRLFFASNRTGGQGGTDIYVSRRLDYTWTKWTEPTPLGLPINSESDDSNPIMVDGNNTIYFTSRRDGTSDIFYVNLSPPPATLQEAITIKGTIRNGKTNEPESGAVFWGAVAMPQTQKFYHTNSGKFDIKLGKNESFRLTPQKQGFTGKGLVINVPELRKQNTLIYEVDLFLNPFEAEQKIEINNIYFVQSMPEVLPASYAELNRVADILKSNKSMQIRIEGHTDSVGNYNSLLDLSRSRAVAIKKYLVDQGIVSARIETYGYGGERPLVPNNSEANKAKNRRVEIFITKPGAATLYAPKNTPNPTVKPIVESKTELKSLQDTTWASIIENKSMDSRISKSIRMNPPAISDTSNSSAAKYQELKKPEKKSELTEITEGTKKTLSSENLPKELVTEAHENNLDNSKPYIEIDFLANTLSIEESSFVDIRRLLDYLNKELTYKIVLIGNAKNSEILPKPNITADQRAKGVKEYLIFKSIAPDRIQIHFEKTNIASHFAGVQVYLEK